MNKWLLSVLRSVVPNSDTEVQRTATAVAQALFGHDCLISFAARINTYIRVPLGFCLGPDQQKAHTI